MPNPLIAILSQNLPLVSQLRSQLADKYRLAICGMSSEVTSLLSNQSASGLVLDFSQTQSGGHAESQLIEMLQESAPDASLVVLTASDCPEPLERCIASTDVMHLQMGDDLESLCAEIRDTFSASIVSESSVVIEDATQTTDTNTVQSDSATVLNGITRKFETTTPQMQHMLSELEVAAKHDVTILLIGETGSGKTYLSRLIHEVSPRRNEPFLTVACGALPAELIESELFGHSKGAFTSAHANKDGKFLAAGRGTVLLDEIDVLGPEQQVKLLRVIETGEFEPVGSNQTHKSQARLVVASNLDLEPLVAQGRFRPDLYYRLNMLKFEVTPLRERKSDIQALAEKFISQFAEKHNVTIRSVDKSLYNTLNDYPWPGNVRELENVIQRAVIYCKGQVLTASQLPSHIRSGTAGPTNDPSVRLNNVPSVPDSSNLGDQIAMTEQEIIEQALFRNNFSRTNTAKDLGISRVTLYNKMKKYDMNK